MVIEISGLNNESLTSLNKIMLADGMPTVNMNEEGNAVAYDLCGWQCDHILNACSILGLTSLLRNHA